MIVDVVGGVVTGFIIGGGVTGLTCGKLDGGLTGGGPTGGITGFYWIVGAVVDVGSDLVLGYAVYYYKDVSLNCGKSLLVITDFCISCKSF